MLIWDNTGVLHRVTPFDPNSRRELHRTTLLGAARLARDIGDTALLVAAVLAGTRDTTQFEADDERADIIRAALAVVGSADSADRARLQCALAGVVSPTSWQERYELSRSAIEIAGRLGDDATLAFVLNATSGYREPDSAEQQVADAELAVTAAGRLSDPIARFHALDYRRAIAFVNADRATADRCQAEMSRIVERTPLPNMEWPLADARSMSCLLDGDITGAEAAANEGLAIASSAEAPEALAAYGAVLLDIRRQQGREHELLDLFREVARDMPGLPVLEALVAFVDCEVGDLDDARVVLARHADSSFELFPKDQPWSGAIGFCAEIAVALDDRASARVAAELLAPYRSLVAATSVSNQGAIARPLGRVAALLGDRDRAEEYFEQALEVNGRLGARFWIALTQVDYAEFLAHGSAAERTRGRDLAAAALESSGKFGYPAVERRATQLLDESERG